MKRFLGKLSYLTVEAEQSQRGREEAWLSLSYLQARKPMVKLSVQVRKLENSRGPLAQSWSPNTGRTWSFDEQVCLGSRAERGRDSTYLCLFVPSGPSADGKVCAHTEGRSSCLSPSTQSHTVSTGKELTDTSQAVQLA